MAVFLAAAGTLAYEILLTRVFSVLMWYHFASLAIAIAMFGLAAGGLVPYLFSPRPGASGGSVDAPPSRGARLSSFSAVFAAMPYLALLLFSRYPAWGGKLLELFHQPYFEPFRSGGARPQAGGEALQVGLLLLFFSLPFAGAGAVFAEAFSIRGREGRTYLVVLGGSAAGVSVYLAAMLCGSGPAAFLFVSALFALSAAAFARKGTARGGTPGGRARIYLAFSALLLLAGLAEARYAFAEIRFVRGRYEPGILWTRWDANSRVAVYPVSGEESSRGWGVGAAYAGKAPEQIGMVVDDTGYTALFGTGRDPASMEAFRANIASAAYRIRGSGSALVIGPGGGKDILCALASGEFSVTAVEVNPLVVRAADVEFGEFTGRPYRMPGVRAVVGEGRNFLASDRNRYDVIQMTQVFGRIPPSAGAFTMTEDHLYTVEAFREYLSHLSDNGVISVTRFVYERRVWRVLALARDALGSMGSPDPSRHVLAFRDRGLLNILVRRTPWPEEEIEAARRYSAEMGFPLAIAPDRPAAGLPGRILAGKDEAAGTPFDFSPPTDDRPFFYYTIAPAAFFSSGAGRASEFEDRSVAMLRGFLIAAAALCAIFLLVPAAVLARLRSVRPAPAATAYMFLAGIGYIVWEIVMIKRLALLFGAPVTAFAAGLTMILAFSGLGGYLAGRKGAIPGRFGLAVAAVLVSAYLYYGGPWLSGWAGGSPAARFAVAAAFTLPPSLAMGWYFPVGLRRFGKDGGPVPFYFAANGAASVLGAALTQALTLNLGYRATTLFGGGIYLACALLLAPEKGTSPDRLEEGMKTASRRSGTRGKAAALCCGAGLLLAFAAGCAPKTGTVEGTATIGGAAAGGAEIQFFSKPGAERTGTPFAVAAAGSDGVFRAELPAGSYHVIGRKTVREGTRDRVYKGEYSRNPVSLRAGTTMTGIRFALFDMTAAGFVPTEGTGVAGIVLSGGKPAAEAFVYAYPEVSGAVRGPAYAAFGKTDREGRFRLALREGTFVIVARRKGGGDETGAMPPSGESGGEGERVALSAGIMKDVGTISLRPPEEEKRLLRAEAGGQEKEVAEVRGTVVRDDGSPGAGVLVMAYADGRMIGRPFAISGRTGDGGAFLLKLPRAGTFYLGARSERGGPVSPGEWVGAFDGTPDHSLTIGRGERKHGIRIRVAEKW